MISGNPQRDWQFPIHNSTHKNLWMIIIELDIKRLKFSFFICSFQIHFNLEKRQYLPHYWADKVVKRASSSLQRGLFEIMPTVPFISKALHRLFLCYSNMYGVEPCGLLFKMYRHVTKCQAFRINLNYRKHRISVFST